MKRDRRPRPPEERAKRARTSLPAETLLRVAGVVKSRRESMLLTLLRAAQACGVTVPTLRRVEQGRPVSPNSYDKIARGLGHGAKQWLLWHIDLQPLDAAPNTFQEGR